MMLKLMKLYFFTVVCASGDLHLAIYNTIHGTQHTAHTRPAHAERGSLFRHAEMLWPPPPALCLCQRDKVSHPAVCTKKAGVQSKHSL